MPDNIFLYRGIGYRLMNPEITKVISLFFKDRNSELHQKKTYGIMGVLDTKRHSQLSMPSQYLLSNIGLDKKTILSLSDAQVQELVMSYLIDEAYYHSNKKDFPVREENESIEKYHQRIFGFFNKLFLPFRGGNCPYWLDKSIYDAIKGKIPSEILKGLSSLETFKHTDFERQTGLIIDRLLLSLEQAGRDPQEIADTMQELYVHLGTGQKEIGEEYKAINIFKKLAANLNLDPDSELYKMCLAVCEDIETNPCLDENGKKLAYHNEEHFKIVMINSFILGKASGFSDEAIGQLLFTSLIHDYQHKKSKENVVKNEGYTTRSAEEPALIEEFSYDKASKFLKEKGFDPNKSEKAKAVLESARLPMILSDIGSLETKIFWKIIKNKKVGVLYAILNSGTEITRETRDLQGLLSEDEIKAINKSKKFFIDNIKKEFSHDGIVAEASEDRIRQIDMLLHADIIASCILGGVAMDINKVFFVQELGLKVDSKNRQSTIDEIRIFKSREDKSVNVEDLNKQLMRLNNGQLLDILVLVKHLKFFDSAKISEGIGKGFFSKQYEATRAMILEKMESLIAKGMQKTVTRQQVLAEFILFMLSSTFFIFSIKKFMDRFF